MRRTTPGERHPEIGVDMVGLGDIYLLAGDSVAASRTYREALGRLRDTHGPDHVLTLDAPQKVAAIRK